MKLVEPNGVEPLIRLTPNNMTNHPCFQHIRTRLTRVNVNEAERVTLLKRRDRFERRPFTIDELKRILKVADDEWRGMILFGLYTGQRLGDIATLTWQNLDLQRAELRLVTTKDRAAAGDTHCAALIPVH